MMTLKMTILAILISASALPIHYKNINIPVEYPKATEISHYVTPKDTNAISVPIEETLPVVEEIVPIEQPAPVKQAINQDKTYEECMQEAFEYTYKMANRMLDDMVDNC